MIARAAALAAACLVASGQAWGQASSPLARMTGDAFDLPAPGRRGEPLRLWATTYRLYAAHEHASGMPLLDKDGSPISPPIAPRDFCRGAVQGGIVVTPRSGEAMLFTFAESAGEPQIDCSAHVKRRAAWVDKLGRSRFAKAKGPFGSGASGEALVPYRSIAVDKSLIPLGSALFVPAARGLRFRGIGGKPLRHDGYFYAADTGGAVRGPQIDLFIGRGRGNPFPSFIRNSSKKAHFDAYLVDDPDVLARLKALHALD